MMNINQAPKGATTEYLRAKAIAEYEAMGEAPRTVVVEAFWPFPTTLIPNRTGAPKFNPGNYEESPY